MFQDRMEHECRFTDFSCLDKKNNNLSKNLPPSCVEQSLTFVLIFEIRQ